jgi:hypothetical protein
MMIACMCIALDTIDGGMTHSRMQSALDVATLSAGIDLLHYSSTTGALAQWQQDARAYYNANMPAGYMSLTMPDSGFTATVTGSPAAGETIQLSAAGTLNLIAPVVVPGTSGNGSGSWFRSHDIADHRALDCQQHRAVSPAKHARTRDGPG